MAWKVGITKKAAKKAARLPKAPKAALKLLWRELEREGPYRVNWPNFGKLRGKGDCLHCHLKKGRPTYVVCWRFEKHSLIERKHRDEEGEIEIYYAWTHEDAPY